MIWTYLAGLFTLPVVIALGGFLGWAFGRDWGYGPCDHCKHLGGRDGYDIGTRSNLLYWLDSTLHARVWARTRRHRRARGDLWRANDAKGVRYMNSRWSPKYML